MEAVNKFYDTFFSGKHDAAVTAEYFGLQDSDKETAKTATTTYIIGRYSERILKF